MPQWKMVASDNWDGLPEWLLQGLELRLLSIEQQLNFLFLSARMVEEERKGN